VTEIANATMELPIWLAWLLAGIAAAGPWMAYEAGKITGRLDADLRHARKDLAIWQDLALWAAKRGQSTPANPTGDSHG